MIKTDWTPEDYFEYTDWRRYWVNLNNIKNRLMPINPTLAQQINLVFADQSEIQPYTYLLGEGNNSYHSLIYLNFAILQRALPELRIRLPRRIWLGPPDPMYNYSEWNAIETTLGQILDYLPEEPEDPRPILPFTLGGDDFGF